MKASSSLKDFLSVHRHGAMITMASALIVAECVVDCVLLWPVRIIDLLLTVVYCGCTLLLPLKPRSMALLLCSLYCLCVVLFPGTPSMLFGVLFALGVTGYYERPSKTSLLVLATASCCIIGFVNTPDSNYPLANAITIITTFLLAAFAGYELARNRRSRWLERQYHAAQEIQQRQHWASHIHDSLTTQLSYAALLASDEALRTNDPHAKETFIKLHDSAMTALDNVHDVIDLLTDNHSNTASNTTLRSRILQLVADNEAKLHDVGITGKTIVEGDITHQQVDKQSQTIIIALLQELFANLIRHARRNEMYFLRIRFTPQQCQITEMNSIPFPNQLNWRGGHGLAQYQQQITAIGGELSYAREGDTWTLRAMIPLINGRRTIEKSPGNLAQAQFPHPSQRQRQRQLCHKAQQAQRQHK